jgi:hypothetical protein
MAACALSDRLPWWQGWTPKAVQNKRGTLLTAPTPTPSTRIPKGLYDSIPEINQSLSGSDQLFIRVYQPECFAVDQW